MLCQRRYRRGEQERRKWLKNVHLCVKTILLRIDRSAFSGFSAYFAGIPPKTAKAPIYGEYSPLMQKKNDAAEATERIRIMENAKATEAQKLQKYNLAAEIKRKYEELQHVKKHLMNLLRRSEPIETTAGNILGSASKASAASRRKSSGGFITAQAKRFAVSNRPSQQNVRARRLISVRRSSPMR